MIASLFVFASVVSVGTTIDDLSYQDLRDLHALLKRPDVRRELQITDLRLNLGGTSEELERLEQLLARTRHTLTLVEVQSLQKSILKERFHLISIRLTERQLLRLHQLRLQYQALAQGTDVVLRKVVKVTSQQSAEINDIVDQSSDELRNMLLDSYRRAVSDLTQPMTSQQRRIWKQKLGDEFQFDPIYQGLTPLGLLP